MRQQLRAENRRPTKLSECQYEATPCECETLMGMRMRERETSCWQECVYHDGRCRCDGVGALCKYIRIHSIKMVCNGGEKTMETSSQCELRVEERLHVSKSLSVSEHSELDCDVLDKVSTRVRGGKGRL